MNTNGTLSYPVFKANQVLTEGHLNAAVSYLEAQTLLTRAVLIGSGIVCGLEPTLGVNTKRPALTVSRGCGVTSDGYLIALDEPCVLAFFRAVTRSSVSEVPGFGEGLPGNGDGQPGDPVVAGLYELFSTDAHADDPDNPTRPFTDVLAQEDEDGTTFLEALADMVVLLLLHVEDEDRDVCLYDCDEAGAQRTFTLRKLAMRRQVAEQIIRAGYDCQGVFAGQTDLDRVFNRAYYLPALSLKRFGYVQTVIESVGASSKIDLEGIKSLSDYLTAYERVCSAATGASTAPSRKVSALPGALLSPLPQINPLFRDIAGAYQRANELFSPFFTGEQPGSNADFKNLEKTLLSLFDKVRQADAAQEKTPQLGIQYFYDYLKDLILAYDELRAAAFDLMDDCLPECNRFPRHLMLGVVSASASCPPSVYRTAFTQPPVYNGNARRLQEVRLLYERMKVMATSFDLPEKAEIKITPSRLAPASLGLRAIPFYYGADSALYQSWDFERTRRCRASQNASYHAEVWQDPFENPLLDTIDAHDFYRIEGHVGKDYAEAIRDIQALRSRYNLAFDLVALKIGLVADSDNIQFDFFFEDLEAGYAKIREELLCLLKDLQKTKPPQDIAAEIQSLIVGLATHPGAPPPDDEPPIDKLPTDKPPTDKPPTDKPPTDKPPTEKPPTDKPPTEKPPTDKPPTEKPPTEKPPTDKPPTEKPPTDKPPTEKPPGSVEVPGGIKPPGGVSAPGSLGSAGDIQRLAGVAMIGGVIQPGGVKPPGGVELPGGDPTKGEGTPDASEGPQDTFLYGDYYDLTRLSQNDHFQQFSKSHTLVFTWARSREDEQQRYFNCAPAQVQPLLNAYTERVVAIRQQFLFHHYVKAHPGAEHLGGVPRGGTFILVYVNQGEEAALLSSLDEAQRVALEKAPDAGSSAGASFERGGVDTGLAAVLRARQKAAVAVADFRTQSVSATNALEEARLTLAALPNSESLVASLDERRQAEIAARANIIVGDFCLPYTCCAKAPAFSLVVAHPRPIVLLEQVSYCANDPGRYPFILHPPNGLLRGPGVQQASGFYEFVPSDEAVQERVKAGETLLTFTYWADGAVDTLTVEILPLRDAGFTGLKDRYCIDPANPDHPDNQRVPLRRNTPGGTFTPDGPPLEEEAGAVFFNPLAVPPGTSVDITYTLPDGGDGCASASTQTVTVLAAPDARFTFGEADTTVFCVTKEDAGQAVTLLPADTDPVAQSVFSGKGVARVDDHFVFDPAQIDAREGPQTITITHTISREDTECEGTLARTVTVLPEADARFTGPGADLFCVNPEASVVTPPPQALRPVVPGGAFTFSVGGSPDQTPLPGSDARAVMQTLISIARGFDGKDSAAVTIQYAVGTEECRDTQAVTFQVALTPDVSFTFGPVCVDQKNPERILLDAEAATPPGGVFEGKAVVEEGSRFFFDTRLVDFGDETATTSEITYRIAESGVCEGVVTLPVEVFLKPEARFDPGRFVAEGEFFILEIPGFQPETVDKAEFTWTTELDPNPRPAVFEGGALRVARSEVGDAKLLSITLVVTRGPCASDPFTVTVEVPQEGGDVVTPGDGTGRLDPRAEVVLNERAETYRGRLNALAAEDSTLKTTKSFDLANGFLLLDLSTPTDDVAQQYDEVMATLRPALLRATDERKAVFADVIETVTLSLFDRLAAAGSKAPDTVSVQISRLAEAGVDLNAVKTNWQADALKTVLPPENVEGHLDLLNLPG